MRIITFPVGILMFVASSVVFTEEAPENRIDDDKFGGKELAVIDSGIMVESTKPGCSGVKCLEPSDEQKLSGCKSAYPEGATGLQACCVIWSCVNKHGKSYSNGTVSGAAAEFPPATQKLPANIPSAPVGSNMTYQTQEKSFNQKVPGFQGSAHSSSYSYSSSSSFTSNSDGSGGQGGGPMVMPMPVPKGGK